MNTLPQQMANIRRWQPFSNAAGTVRGFLDAEMSSGIIVNRNKLMVGPNGRYWIAPPSIKQTNADGTPRLDANGRQVWSPVIEFASRAARDRFNELVLAALRREHPEAFDEESVP